MGHVHVIAEAGTNHGGDVATGERLIDVAVEAGADSVKFQIINPDGLYLPRIWTDGRLVDNEVFDLRRASQLPDDGFRRLASHAAERGIPMSASVFDPHGLDLLDEFDPPYIKIASCDLNNGPLLKEAAGRGRTMVVSTGMSELPEIERAVQDVLSTGNSDLVLLHCVSIYPAPTELMNLSFLRTLQTEFGFPVGLSDHTEEPVAALAAVAMGAVWIEKHYTLDRSTPGFDHAYAVEPEALRDLVGQVRRLSEALTARDPKVSPAEAAVRARARRALYAARELAAGDVVEEDDVFVVRPEGPLEPAELGRVLGRPVSRRVQRFEPLTWDMFG